MNEGIEKEDKGRIKQPSKRTHVLSKSPMVAGLRLMFARCGQHLTHLSISGIGGGNLASSAAYSSKRSSTFTGEDVLLHVTLRCRNLQSLDVSWTNVTDKSVSALAWACPELRQIDVSGCSSVSDAGVVAIVDALGGGCGGGREGDDGSGNCGVSAGVCGVNTAHAGSSGVLRHLDVSGCVGVTNFSFHRVVANCSRDLRHLGVGGLFRLPHSLLLSELPKFTALSSLNLRNSKQIRDPLLKNISKSCLKLEELRLGGCGLITDEGIIHLAANFANNAAAVDASDNRDDKRDAGREITRKQRIGCKSASTTPSKSTSASGATTHRGRLRRLELEGCGNIGDDSIRALVNSDLPLQHLDVSGTAVSAKGIQLLANFVYRTLEEVKCNFLKDVADGSCFTKLVRHCKKLRLLEVVGVKVGGCSVGGGGVDGGGRGAGSKLRTKCKEINEKLVFKDF